MLRYNNKNKIFSSNSGSALIMAILIMIVLSILGSVVIMLSIYNFQMSGFYSEYNKAYFLAESGAEIVAKVIDKKVADIQEKARASATTSLGNEINNDPLTLRSTNNDGSINYDDANTQFNDKFSIYYYQGDDEYNGIESEFENIINIDYKKELLDNPDKEVEVVEGFPCIDFNDEGQVYLANAQFNSGTHIIAIETEGVYNGYRKKLSVKFDLTLTDPNDSPSSEYKISVREPLRKKPELDNIFQLKGETGNALVAEKNVIVTDGKLKVINGGILAFGTVPSEMGLEDDDAEWYQYGGVMAGICSEVVENSSSFGFNSSELELPDDDNSAGIIDVDGDIATMGYIHSLYGKFEDSSDITIGGNAYARAVVSEINANYSVFDFKKDVCTLDNLQLDSNKSIVTVQGNYYGLIDTGCRIDGLGGESEETVYKKSSSVLINGDSNINFLNGVYIWGTTFFNNFYEEPYEISDRISVPYMTGISAMKSSLKLHKAYTIDGTTTDDHTEGMLYWDSVLVPEVDPPSSVERYINNEDKPQQVISGRSGADNIFPIGQKTIHFLGIWGNLWNYNDPDAENDPDADNDLYRSYLNTDNITIMEKEGEPGEIKGYSSGAVVANGKVYAPGDITGYAQGKIDDEENIPFELQREKLKDYYNAIHDFIITPFVPDPLDLSKPDEGNIKLNYVEPEKSVKDPVNPKYVANKINEQHKTTTNNGILFYASGENNGFVDVEIDASVPNNVSINTKPLESYGDEYKGVILVNGNIYIKGNFNFTGIILATGNIIFLGGESNITYDYGVIETLANSDLVTKGFFNLLEYNVTGEDIKHQRIVSNRFKIIEWKEITP